MLLVAKRRVIDDGFVVELHQRVDEVVRRLGLKQALLLLDNSLQIVNVNALGRRLRRDLGLKDLTLFLVYLRHPYPDALQVPRDEVDAVLRVLHDHLELKLCILILGLAPDERDVIRAVHIPLYLLERWEGEPSD